MDNQKKSGKNIHVSKSEMREIFYLLMVKCLLSLK